MALLNDPLQPGGDAPMDPDDLGRVHLVPPAEDIEFRCPPEYGGQRHLWGAYVADFHEQHSTEEARQVNHVRLYCAWCASTRELRQ